MESLEKITYPNYQAIVADNGSEGDDARILRKSFGDYVHPIENDKKYGFAGGNDTGVGYAFRNQIPDYVFVLNNHTVVDAEFLTELVKAVESNERDRRGISHLQDSHTA